jgi:hypothetical protein
VKKTRACNRIEPHRAMEGGREGDDTELVAGCIHKGNHSRQVGSWTMDEQSCQKKEAVGTKVEASDGCVEDLQGSGRGGLTTDCSRSAVEMKN